MAYQIINGRRVSFWVALITRGLGFWYHSAPLRDDEPCAEHLAPLVTRGPFLTFEQVHRDAERMHR